MDEEEGGGGDIPEWVVTFGDMMSLLLTFFIMLVSLSEIKQEEKYQAMVESLTQRFGYDRTPANPVPGESRPRNSPVRQMSTAGRAQKLDTKRGGDKVKAPVGDHPRVRIVRPGSKTSIGTVIYFDEGSAELTAGHREILIAEEGNLAGKQQKIEVRGHTSRRPVSPDKYRDNWDLAYERCRNTVRYMVDELKIEPQRIRVSVAGPNEPVHIGADPEKMRQNPRVEIYLLDEVVSDLSGTKEEWDQRFTEGEEL